jgi:hypothetical protein
MELSLPSRPTAALVAGKTAPPRWKAPRSYSNSNIDINRSQRLHCGDIRLLHYVI